MNEIIKQRIEQINRGETPQGYKKTAVGIVPQEWESNKTFGDIFEFFGGLGIARDGLGNNGVPYLHYGDMHKNTFTKVSYSQYLNLPKYDTEIKGKETFLLNDGDMVFLDASEDLSGTSRCVVIDNPENKPFISGLHTFVAKPKKNILNKEYKQYLATPQGVQRQFERLASGFKVYGLNQNTLKKISISYPKTLAEQQRIAEILSKWDEAIALQEKLIDKLEEKKKALMQKLLSPKDGWKLVPLKKVLKERKTYSTKGLEFTHVTLSKQGVCDKTEQYNRDFLVASGEKGYKTTYLNDLCYNPANLKFGVICLNKYGSAIFSPIYVTFEISDKYNCDFIGAILSSNNFVKKIRRFEEGSLYERQAVKPKDFIKDSILLPDRNIQDKISKAILIFNDKMNYHSQKLQKLKQQQKAMQQLLLTGIVRV